MPKKYIPAVLGVTCVRVCNRLLSVCFCIALLKFLLHICLWVFYCVFFCCCCWWWWWVVVVGVCVFVCVCVCVIILGILVYWFQTTVEKKKKERETQKIRPRPWKQLMRHNPVQAILHTIKVYFHTPTVPRVCLDIGYALADTQAGLTDLKTE